MVTWRRKTVMPTDASGLVGTVRLARRDDDLAALDEGEIAVVELPDLDAQHA